MLVFILLYKLLHFVLLLTLFLYTFMTWDRMGYPIQNALYWHFISFTFFCLWIVYFYFPTHVWLKIAFPPGFSLYGMCTYDNVKIALFVSFGFLFWCSMSPKGFVPLNFIQPTILATRLKHVVFSISHKISVTL